MHDMEKTGIGDRESQRKTEREKGRYRDHRRFSPIEHLVNYRSSVTFLKKTNHFKLNLQENSDSKALI